MSEQPLPQNPYVAHLRNHWRRVGTYFVVAIALAVLTSIFLVRCDPDYVHVIAVLPEQLPVAGTATIPVQLESVDREVAGLQVEILHHRYDGYQDLAELYQSGEMTSLGTATTDERGRAVVEVASPPRGEAADADVTEVLVVVARDGSAEWVSYREIRRSDATTLALSLDRPLYQPGQAIKARALVIQTGSGGPIESDVTFEIYDPRDNLVFRDEKRASAHGIAAIEMPLADRCAQGEYRIEASTPTGAQRTSTFSVRPFRLPRFKVEVQVDEPVVEPGRPVTGRVVATYTHGAPVEGGEAEVSLSSDAFQSQAVAGQTDVDGAFRFELATPTDAQAGATLVVGATVRSATGRTESGSATTKTSGTMARFELVPSRQPAFVAGYSYPGYIIVTTATGEPIVGAGLEVTFPESDKERTVKLTTDAKGRAPVEWKADSQGRRISVLATLPDGQVIRTNLVPNVAYQQATIAPKSAAIDAGSQVAVDVRAESAVHGWLMLHVGGRARSATKIDVDSSSSASATLEVPADVAGLGEIVLISDRSAVARAPVWIRQSGGETVTVTPDASEYRPGSQAKVALAFPPGEKKGDAAPVAFGLVGVDEALYALQERADVPLPLLMRGTPREAVAALRHVPGPDADEADTAIGMSRFRSEMAGHVPGLAFQGSDISSEVRRHKRAPWLWVLLVAIACATLACAWRMARATWRSFDRHVFSWRRGFLLMGVAVMSGFAAGAFAASAGGEALGGGLFVWLMVVLAWLFAGAILRPELELGSWLGVQFLGIVLLTCGFAVVDELRRTSDFAPQFYVAVAVVLPAGLAMIEALIWCFALLRAGLPKPALGLVSLFGIAVLGTLGLSLSRSGGMAPRLEEAEFAMATSAPEPMAQMPMAPSRAKKVAMDMPATEMAPGAVEQPSPAEAPRVRSWFPETMVWIPEILSDAAGKAVAVFEVPDSITTWRLDAWANSTDGRFGEGRGPLLAVKPFFVEIDSPTTLTHQDVVEIPVSLVNRSSDPVTGSLSIESEGLVVRRVVGGTPNTLPPGGRATAIVEVRAAELGVGSITATSLTAEGIEGDAVRREIRVTPDGPTLRDSRSGFVGNGWKTTLSVPDDAFAASAGARIIVYPSVVADAMEGLGAMLRQPQGCFEQTSSANFPNVMILRTLQETKAAEWPGGAEAWEDSFERADRLVRTGYQKMLTFQNGDGGFGLYPGRPSDVMLTAYGLMQLVEMKAVTTVDPQVIASAARWLAAQQRSDGSFPSQGRISGSSGGGEDVGMVRTNSFVAVALAMAGGSDDTWDSSAKRAMARVVERVDFVESTSSLAWAASGHAAIEDMDAARKVLARLSKSAKREGGVVFWGADTPTWMGGRGVFADRETTAVAAWAMLRAQQADLLPGVLAYIARERSPWGGWGSTQTTVWTLRTLAELRKKSNSPTKVSIAVDGDRLATAAGADDFELASPKDPMHELGTALDLGDHQVEVTSTADSTAMVQAITEYAVPWASRSADRGEEPYELDLKTDGRDWAFGRAVTLFASIRNPGLVGASTLIFEVPVPPGAFVPTAELEQAVERGQIDSFEVLPTHIRLYIPELGPSARSVVRYQVVPLLRGTFSLPPLRAYQFYTPQPYTESDPGDLRTR